MQRVRLLNGQFDPLTSNQTVDAVFSSLRAGKRGWVCTINVATLMMMRTDVSLQKFVDHAAIVVADGKPLVWCASWLGQHLPERVAGIDLVDALCERAAAEDRGVYLLGATGEVVTKVAQHLRTRYADLRIECADGYFTKDEAPGRADRIRTSEADILLVGMGVPRQERFIEEHWDRLGVGMAIGVGGSFDVLAGGRARAPKLMQKIGMEWFFRLVQEPRRLLVRYVVTNSKFCWLVLRALMRKRRHSPPHNDVVKSD